MKAVASLVLLASLSAGQQFLPSQSPAVRLASAGTTFIEGANPRFSSTFQRRASQQGQNQQFFEDANRGFSQVTRSQQDQNRFQSTFRPVINEHERVSSFPAHSSRDNAFYIQQQRDIEFAAQQQRRGSASQSHSSRRNPFLSQSSVAFQDVREQPQFRSGSAFQQAQFRSGSDFQQPQLRSGSAFQQSQLRSGSDFNFDQSSEYGVFEPLNLPSGASALLGGISSSFSCADKPYGYYADPDNYCRVFYICNPALFPDGRVETYQYPFFCGEGTIFDQNRLTCVHEFEATPCQDAQNFYFRNEVFGRDVEV